jgi:hypothetical protein
LNDHSGDRHWRPDVEKIGSIEENLFSDRLTIRAADNVKHRSVATENAAGGLEASPETIFDSPMWQ